MKFGNIPPFDPTNATQVGWAEETTLDVEYAHSIAPGAKIVLAETPVAETEGVTGFPEMMNAEQSLINAGVGDVISQSFGATENTFPGFSQGNYSSLLNLRYAFKDALAHHVTVLAASGDDGATNDETDGSTLYPYRVNSWPSSDPLVTSVGGTQLNLDNAGNRLHARRGLERRLRRGRRRRVRGLLPAAVPDRRPRRRRQPPRHPGHLDERRGQRRGLGLHVLRGHRDPGVSDPGWYIFGGTSEATPIFSGIVALADQVAGHRLGLINPALYRWARSASTASTTGIVDITTGNNSFGGVTGYDADPGYDLASGWGTIDAAQFVPALAFTASH